LENWQGPGRDLCPSAALLDARVRQTRGRGFHFSRLLAKLIEPSHAQLCVRRPPVRHACYHGKPILLSPSIVLSGVSPFRAGALIWVPSRPCNKGRLAQALPVTARMSGYAGMNNRKTVQFYLSVWSDSAAFQRRKFTVFTIAMKTTEHTSIENQRNFNKSELKYNSNSNHFYFSPYASNDKKAQLTQGLRATSPLFQDGRQPQSSILSNRK